MNLNQNSELLEVGVTYNIAICSPLSDIPFDCDVPSWIKRVVSFCIEIGKYTQNLKLIYMSWLHAFQHTPLLTSSSSLNKNSEKALYEK